MWGILFIKIIPLQAICIFILYPIADNSFSKVSYLGITSEDKILYIPALSIFVCFDILVANPLSALIISFKFSLKALKSLSFL